jgi:hypothetical protein
VEVAGKPVSQGQYLGWLAQQMREAVKQTQRFDREWNVLNDAINAKFDTEDVRRREIGREPLSPLQRAEAKQVNLTLSDAYGAGQWWRGKAVYLASVLQAEVAYDNWRRER